jgi:DNA-binding NarL/FixJ family response regulator
MIRVLVVDDHPAMRTGLTAVLRAEPGFVPLAAAEGEHDVLAALDRTRPDVVLLDYHLPTSDGLVLCRRIKRTLPPPAVLLYSAFADASLAIPAILAGADGLLHKSAPAHELYDAVRTVARGERVLPPVGRELLDVATATLESGDLPILGMVLGGTPPAEIASTLNTDTTVLSRRIDRMLERLRVEVPTAAAGT